MLLFNMTLGLSGFILSRKFLMYNTTENFFIPTYSKDFLKLHSNFYSTNSNLELQLTDNISFKKYLSYETTPRHALGICICGCSLFYRRELWAWPRVQKVMSQRSTGSCTCCTRANAFTDKKYLDKSY